MFCLYKNSEGRRETFKILAEIRSLFSNNVSTSSVYIRVHCNSKDSNILVCEKFQLFNYRNYNW